MLTLWPYNPMIKEWRKPHKPCDLKTPDCGAECTLHINTIRRNKLMKQKWNKCSCNLKNIMNFGCNICGEK